MISCSDAKNLINSYIDGLLNEADCTSFEEHISCCESCHHEYDTLKSMLGDLSDSKSALPTDFAKKMHIALVNNQLKDNKKKKESFFGLPYMKLTTVAATAIMIAVVGKFGIYDVYRSLSSETLQTRPIITENTGKEIAVPGVASDTPDKTDVAPGPEKVDEKVKVVDVVKKSNDADTSQNTYTANTVEESIPEVTKATDEAPPPQAPIQTEAAEEVAPLLDLARMAPDTTEGVEFETDETTPTATEESVPSDKISPDITADNAEEVEAEESAADESTDKRKPISSGGDDASAEEDIISDGAVEEFVSEEIKFIPEESASPTPTMVEIYKSGEGNMPTIKNYLYTFLDGSEIAEADGQITITIDADEYESVMKKINANEYVKSITVGNISEGKAVIIIK